MTADTGNSPGGGFGYSKVADAFLKRSLMIIEVRVPPRVSSDSEYISAVATSPGSEDSATLQAICVALVLRTVATKFSLTRVPAGRIL